MTALVALGVAQLAAAILSSPIGAPVAAVGELSIDHTPPAVKNFAIREFGSSDKTVLVWGIRGVLIIFAIIIGILAVRRLWYGLAGLAVFGAIGVYAALIQPSAKGTDALPSIIGTAVAALALRYFSRLAGGLAARRARREPGAPEGRTASAGDSADRGTQGGAAPGGSWAPASGTPRDEDRPDGTPPGRGPAEGTPAGGAPDSAPPAPGAPVPPGPSRGAPAPGSPVWRDVGPALAADDPGPDRRRFLLSSVAVAAVSLITYAGGSWLGESRDVNAIQHALKLPAPATPAPPLPPGTSLKIPGLSPFITPNSSFYRVDTAIVLPEIVPATWQLRIHGMVRKELVLSFDDLIQRPLIEDYITLCCVSNPVARSVYRQRQVARRQPAGACCRRPASRPGPISCSARPRTASPRALRCRRPWTAGTRCWRWR